MLLPNFVKFLNWQQSKAMPNSEIYVILCYAEIDLNRIPTLGNLTEINPLYYNFLNKVFIGLAL